MHKRKFSQELLLAANQNTKTRDYWFNKLSGNIVRSGFPYDSIKRTHKEDLKKIVTFTLPKELFTQLINITRGSDYTMHVILTAILKVLLYRYTGIEDIIVGTPIYKQEVEAEFINTVLVLRDRVKKELTFKEFLLQVKQTIVEAVENQNYPIEILSDQLGMPILANEFSLFDVVLLLENIHHKKYIGHIHSHLNMIFSFRRTPHCLEGTVEYNPLLYEKSTIQRITRHFIQLQKQVIFTLNLQISRIEILLGEEKRQLLYEFNETETQYPRAKTLHELFEEQAEKTPDNIAVVGFSKKTDHRFSLSLTYKELNEKSNQLARFLRSRGLKSETIVGLTAEICNETIIGMIGILKAEGIFLPIDPDYPRQRIEYMIADSNLEILLTTEPMEDRFQFNGKIVDLSDPSLFTIARNSEDAKVKKANRVNRSVDMAYVMYTSGSTGTPKGVMIEHRNIVNQIHGLKEMFFTGVRLNHILLAPFTFDPSVQHVFSPLTYGGKLYLASREIKMDAEKLLAFIVEKGIDIIDAVPSQMYLLEEFAGKYGKIKLKYIILAGEVFPYDLYLRLEQTFSVEKIINIYGPTEAAINSTYYECGKENNRSIIPIGKPLRNYKIRILDDQLNLLPIGVTGQIFIAGEGISRGYSNCPELTKEKFIENPFVPGERMYGTGDLARWLPDKNIEFVGRGDQQVKIRGMRVEIGEIENRLLKQEGIKEAVVIHREDREGHKYLCAYYISEKEIEGLELKRILSSYLPAHMVPSYFVRLDKIPLTANDKLDRKALPVPQLESASQYMAPRDEVEEALAGIWSQLLNLEKEKIGIDADFFEIGGHSLKATILESRIHKTFNTKIPLRKIFETPTIRELAIYIKGGEEDKYTAVESAEHKEYYPVSPAQKRLYILQQMEVESTGYNMPHIIRIESEVDKDRLKQAFSKLIKRHESLRTSFEMIKGQPVQRVHAHEEVVFELGYHSSSSSGSQVQDIIRCFVRPFDLPQAPLLRAAIVDDHQQQSSFILMVDMHHIVADGISNQILVKDFLAFYRGEELSKLRLQYKDYSEWRNKLSGSRQIKKQEAYWLNRFAGEVPVLNLPIDYPRPVVQRFEGRTTGFEIDAADTERLRDFSGKIDATLFMVLLAAFNVLLMKLSGQEDIVVGTPIAGRRHADLEQAIGMFLNTLPLRSDIGGDLTFATFVEKVREDTLDAFENQEFQFEDLVEKVAARRDTSRNPLFDVMFLMQNRDEDRQTPTAKKGIEKSTFVDYEAGVAKFDITISAMEAKNTLAFSVNYCRKLFKDDTIRRFVLYFKQIISKISQNPGEKIAGIEIIGEKEKTQLLYDFNDTQARYPKDKTIQELFTKQVKQNPDHAAVIGKAQRAKGLQARAYRRCVLTYKELNKRAGQLARELRKKGVKPGTIVGLAVYRSLEMITGILGILKAGGAYLPIDPETPVERINYIVQDSGTKVLVTREELFSMLEQIHYQGEKVDVCDRRFDMPGNTNLNLETDTCECNSAHDPAYVIYTSGSTGRPKGVVVEHWNTVNFVKGITAKIDFAVGKTILALTTISFDIFFLETLLPLMRGLQVVVADEIEQKDPAALVDAIINHKVNMLQVTPSRLVLIINSKVNLESLGHLEELMVGGEAFPDPLLDYLQKEFAGKIKIYNLYGPTETTIWSTVKDVTRLDKINIGSPISNTRVFILDRCNRLQPVGLVGELCIEGDGLARGYLNRPWLTAEKFTANFFIGGKWMYRTGDLARWLSNGDIECLGRTDHQLKIRGFRVEPGEIENRLLRHPEIEEAIVIDREKQGGQKYLCAYYISKSELDAPGLQLYLSGQLPDYMIPSYFVRLEKVPLNPAGKIDRKKLPAPEFRGSEDDYVVPESDKEKIIANIWKQVLGIDKVGILDNFFQIGGNSLEIIQVNSQLQEVFNVDIPVVTMFRYPTIDALAGYLSNENPSETIADEKIDKFRNKMAKTLKISRGTRR
ncbi:MAG: amino acid adenylation domain-containing protein [Candidatus Aminicenantes bacterium]|nr:amino acid adenylation domain-containing protein [Candidatus Aminicenantes bacterium]NIM83462.1 amino acid adenylation domain-containing protein [Candidatus Aminicenantes bacterium]NIN22854.1 amino acid adenylation domain-containing protein [Candidatus Aminicenantes bacterium]NIN46590.1 amino acid adenylation domain-containing protein [Candidatus Aminicenantes bacterium]NIN89493.1 amino acid adenylation domain-containing protein [Candidatus Aminicenantes bacterium]